jgi:flagellar biosynthetic protein FliQ
MERNLHLSPVQIILLSRDAMIVTLLIAAPMLLSGLVVGFAISVFQSVTQIQEITLTFVPEIVTVMTAFILFLPWMLSMMIRFATPIFGDIHNLLR